jgi:hypothetical protein
MLTVVAMISNTQGNQKKKQGHPFRAKRWSTSLTSSARRMGLLKKPATLVHKIGRRPRAPMNDEKVMKMKIEQTCSLPHC